MSQTDRGFESVARRIQIPGRLGELGGSEGFRVCLACALGRLNLSILVPWRLRDIAAAVSA
jgi:hypothetical protein